MSAKSGKLGNSLIPRKVKEKSGNLDKKLVKSEKLLWKTANCRKRYQTFDKFLKNSDFESIDREREGETRYKFREKSENSV